MSTTKQRRGFKGKIALTNLYNFEPLQVTKAYEKDGELFIELANGDSIRSEYVYLCNDMNAAWELYADHIKEKTGNSPKRRF